jgi:effector-binding domain-containing protein
MGIATNQKLHVKNLITMRKKLKQADMPAQLKLLQDYIDKNGARKVGGGISATYSVDSSTMAMEIELYVPLDKNPSSGDFVFKPELLLTNCLKVSHKGNPQLLQNSLESLNKYVAENKLIPISVGFSVTVNEVTNTVDVEEFQVDTYVSISPNVV